MPGVDSRPSIRVDYHLHTQYSYDCTTPPEAVIERAVRAGLSTLCITDHDTIEGALHVERIRPPEIEVIIGCEFSTDDGSQVIGLDLKDVVPGMRVMELLHSIREQGGLVLLPHPFRRGSGIFRSENRRSAQFVSEVLALTDLVECFNGRDNYEQNLQSHRLAVSLGLPAVAGSDAHTVSEIGSVFVEYQADDREHGISPRRVFFPDRPARRESPVKRGLMEFYHRHEAQLPKFVSRAYRASRDGLRRDQPPDSGLPPAMQYEFQRASAYPGSRAPG